MHNTHTNTHKIHIQTYTHKHTSFDGAAGDAATRADCDFLEVVLGSNGLLYVRGYLCMDMWVCGCLCMYGVSEVCACKYGSEMKIS